jgi:hypothetical protein
MPPCLLCCLWRKVSVRVCLGGLDPGFNHLLGYHWPVMRHLHRCVGRSRGSRSGTRSLRGEVGSNVQRYKTGSTVP